MKTPNFHDVEQISALLDGKLSRTESIKLESRIGSDPSLQALMDDLSETRGFLRRLPKRKAPRNFTLSPRMAGVKPPVPRAVPGLRFATVLATFLLVFSVATNALAPTFRQAAQAPVYGMGGGGAEAPSIMSAPATEAPAATSAPALEQTAPEDQSFSSPAATMGAEDSNRTAVTATPEAALKGFAPEQPAPRVQSEPLPIPQIWIIVLLVVALVSGGLAWLVRWISERSWRAKMK
jgi:anti-sigma factor RsiW